MSFNETYFAPMSNYSNTKKGMPMDEQEAWLDQFPQKRAENKPNHGIIQSVADTRELFLRPMSKADRAAAVAKAQREHRQALKNLAKQEAQDAKEIAKQLAEWRKESKKPIAAKEIAADKEAKRLKRNLLNTNRRKELTRSGEMSTKKGREVLEKLKADGVICVADWDMERKYLSFIMTDARELGYKIGSIKSGRFVTHYTLDKQ
ncbi:hypothetical protein [Psychrobacter phage vB_PmaS_Y8A]|nr:hypothetical protein [Psychrobacter phage vB_PmaS_Y8A]